MQINSAKLNGPGPGRDISALSINTIVDQMVQVISVFIARIKPFPFCQAFPGQINNAFPGLFEFSTAQPVENYRFQSCIFVKFAHLNDPSSEFLFP
jgi:hypothetical protein